MTESRKRFSRASTPTGSRAGRPRDPELEARALAMARSVYAKHGWSGFTLDEVARRSKIGKGSLYLRWQGKATLLVAAIRSRTGLIADIDTGTVRSDLLAFATTWYHYLRSDEGALLHRMWVDARFAPELRNALAHDPLPEYLPPIHAIIQRGIDRGELPADTSTTVITDLVAGAISNYAYTLPECLVPHAHANIDGYLIHLIDTVLIGTYQH